MRKLTSILLGVVLALGMVGCHPRVKPSVPEAPAVTFQRTLLGAADAVNVVASGVKAVDECRKQLELTKQITPEQSTAVLNYLKNVAIHNQAAVESIKVAELAGDTTATNWSAQLVEVTKAINQVDPKLFGIKNADAQASLRASLASLSSIAQVMQISFGGR